jgi:ABC-2 type transport system permease protein
MVMKQKYGSDNMHRFLKHELDQYLRGRAGEIRKGTSGRPRPK